MKEMTLEEIRKEIDQTDAQIKKLFLQRMELALMVAQTKAETGDAVYKPDRETEVLKRQSADLPQGLCRAYTAVQKKMMAASRMVQYEYLREHQEGSGGETKEQGYCRRIVLKKPDAASMTALLTILADYGVQVRLLPADSQEEGVSMMILPEGGLRSGDALYLQLTREIPGLTIT